MLLFLFLISACVSAPRSCVNDSAPSATSSEGDIPHELQRISALCEREEHLEALLRRERRLNAYREDLRTADRGAPRAREAGEDVETLLAAIEAEATGLQTEWGQLHTRRALTLRLKHIKELQFEALKLCVRQRARFLATDDPTFKAYAEEYARQQALFRERSAEVLGELMAGLRPPRRPD